MDEFMIIMGIVSSLSFVVSLFGAIFQLNRSPLNKIQRNGMFYTIMSIVFVFIFVIVVTYTFGVQVGNDEILNLMDK